MLDVQLLEGDLDQAHRVHGAVNGHLARGGAHLRAGAQVKGAVYEARLAHFGVANDADVDVVDGLQDAAVSGGRGRARRSGESTCLHIHRGAGSLLLLWRFSEGVVRVAGALVGEALDDALVAQEEGIAADGVAVVVAAAVADVGVPRAGYVTILCAAMRGIRRLLWDLGRGIGPAAERRALQFGRAGGGDALRAGLVLRRDGGRQGRRRGRRERAARGMLQLQEWILGGSGRRRICEAQRREQGVRAGVEWRVWLLVAMVGSGG